MPFILIDNNLSPKLSNTLRAHHPEVRHVLDLGLDKGSDTEIWDYVKIRAGAIITKDADFLHLLNRYGHPPKIIRIKTGNSTTPHIIQLLQAKSSIIQMFLANPALGLLELY